MVALFALFAMDVDAFLRPPAILFLGPSDDQSVSLLRLIQERFPFLRIATMVGSSDKSMNKRIEHAILHGYFRRRRNSDDLEWLDSLDELIEIAQIYVLDARTRRMTEAVVGRIIEAASGLFEMGQDTIGVERPLSMDSLLRARPELLEQSWVSPELQLEIRRLLLSLRNDRAARTIVVVDSDGRAPLLDKIFREAAEIRRLLYREPAQKVTVGELSGAVEKLLRNSL